MYETKMENTPHLSTPLGPQGLGRTSETQLESIIMYEYIYWAKTKSDVLRPPTSEAGNATTAFGDWYTDRCVG